MSQIWHHNPETIGVMITGKTPSIEKGGNVKYGILTA